MNLSITLFLWKLVPHFGTVGNLLHGSLWTLSNQTRQPLEIIFVNAAADLALAEEVRRVCQEYPLVKVIDAPQEDLNLSRNFNIGIRASSPGADYVMATNPEFLFSPTVLETLLGLMSPTTSGFLPCGMLPRHTDIGEPKTVWDRWPELVSQVATKEPPAGILSCLPREWVFKVRGYDEIKTPYNNNDSDLAWRAHLDGLKYQYVPWEQCQMLHRWHPRLPEYNTIESPVPNESEREIVRNLEHWGEYV